MKTESIITSVFGIAFIAVMLATVYPVSADLPLETFFATFQQGVDGYEGTRDTMMDAHNATWDTDDWRDTVGRLTYNYGSRDHHINLQGQSRRSLLKFEDIFGPGGIPADVTADDIISATLTLTLYDSYRHTGGSTHRLYMMLTPWEAGSSNNAVEDGASSSGLRFYRADGNYSDGDFWGDGGMPAEGENPPLFPRGNDLGDLVGTHPYLNEPGQVTHSGERGVDAWTHEYDITAALKAWADGQENYGFLVRGHGTWDRAYWYSSNWEANPEWRPLLTVEYIPEPSSLLLLGAGSLLALMRRRR